MPWGDADVVGEEAVFGAGVAEEVAGFAAADSVAGFGAVELVGATAGEFAAGRCFVVPETPATGEAEVAGVVRGGATGTLRVTGSTRT